MDLNNIEIQIETIIEKSIYSNYKLKKPVFIMYVSAYFKNSAGIMAQYKLANDIKKMGFEVYGVLWDEWSKLNSNFVEQSKFKTYHNLIILPKEFAIQMCRKYNCIAIYTDHDCGNLLNAKISSRWLGYRPGKLGTSEFHDENELIFSFNKYFSNYQQNPKPVGLLSIYPMIDELHKLYFYDKNIKKTKISVYTGKKNYIDGFIDHYDVMITRKFPSNKIQLAEILKETKILYTFDQCTALIYEAMLCGCHVIIINTDNIYSNDELLNSEIGNFGLSIYGDKIDESIQSNEIEKHVYDKILQINKSYEQEHLPNFIKIVTEKFNEKYECI